MDTKPHPDFMKAGKIAGKVLSIVEKEVHPGVPVLKICQLAEEKILEFGATGLAFPCNVSINEEAAHYTSPANDTKKFPNSGLVKRQQSRRCDQVFMLVRLVVRSNGQ
jgi:methionyl aminopeptidase